ncbi:hypothetical protein DX903_05845 [Adlercreutzia equolifaciens]|nr:hypothetical protein DX903_05845 [Adlercreutzia equolifaciens]
MPPPDQIAFPKGTHVFTSSLGTAVVHVPEDDPASAVAPALRRFAERSEGVEQSRSSAPDAPKAAA